MGQGASVQPYKIQLFVTENKLCRPVMSLLCPWKSIKCNDIMQMCMNIMYNVSTMIDKLTQDRFAFGIYVSSYCSNYAHDAAINADEHRDKVKMEENADADELLFLIFAPFEQCVVV